MNNEFENNMFPQTGEDVIADSSAEEIIGQDEFIAEEVSAEEVSAGEAPEQEASFDDEPAEEAVYEEIPEEKAEYETNVVTDEKPKKKSRFLALKIIALVVVCCILLGGVFTILTELKDKHRGLDTKIGTSEYDLTKSESIAPQSAIAQIAQLRMPSVVAITSRSVSDVITFFGTYSQESTSSGSGIIIGQNETELLIVTNYHVVANSEKLSVVFSAVERELEIQSEKGMTNVFDNERIPSAIIKGYDAEKDLAVIAVYLDEIPKDVVDKIEIAPIGDSSKMLPGDSVIAIGNSLGYGQSVTTGIISAVNRKIRMQSSDGRSTVTNSFIQTDAAINQGNSGGALLDMAGNVIGINSAKIATTGVEGMGYAIPISDVETIIKNLMAQKSRELVAKEKQGYLGIMGSEVQEREAELYGIPMGVYVSEVTKGLAAEKAGIKKGDVITGFDGYGITTMSQLQDKLKYYAEGEKVTVTVKSPVDGKYKEKKVEVTLSNKSENTKEE